MVLLLTFNTVIVMVPFPTTSVVITLVGAFTSPLVIFILPGYLYYDQLRTEGARHIDRWLSLGLSILGIILLLVMTTISIYVIRIDYIFNTGGAATRNYYEL